MIAASWDRMGEEADACARAGIEILHLDVMDGHFVRNLTMGPDMVRAIKKRVPQLILDVHLMIYSPEDYIEAFVEAGAEEITFHLESTENVEHTIDYIKKCNRKAGLAIRPETSESLVMKYLGKVDKVLVMTVEPGHGGQKFMPKMLEKVKFLREQLKANHLKTDIQVDGGVDLKTGKESVLAGANRLVCGTYFFKQEDKKATVKAFKELKKLNDFGL